MTAFDQRGGPCTLRTPTQLAEDTTILLALYVKGQACLSFPPGSPCVFLSPLVPPPNQNLTVRIHWSQWSQVLLPIIGDTRLSEWLCVVPPFEILATPRPVWVENQVVPEGTDIGRATWNSSEQTPLFKNDLPGWASSVAALIRDRALSEGF